MMDFAEEARRQLLAEDAAAFDRRVKERATRLAEQHRREMVSDFPPDPAACRARYDELTAELRRLETIRPKDRSAVDDHNITTLRQRIHEVAKRCRQQGTLSREAA